MWFHIDRLFSICLSHSIELNIRDSNNMLTQEWWLSHYYMVNTCFQCIQNVQPCFTLTKVWRSRESLSFFAESLNFCWSLRIWPLQQCTISYTVGTNSQDCQHTQFKAHDHKLRINSIFIVKFWKHFALNETLMQVQFISLHDRSK